jgi:hypothetical protein
MIPADAMAKADEAVKNGRDFYKDLNDEERAEEDLPPLEGAKASDPEPERQEPADVPEEDDDEEDGDDDIEDVGERLLSEIADLRKNLVEAASEAEAPKGAKAEERFLDEALQHEDPAVRALAAELQEAKQALQALHAIEAERRIGAQMERDNAEFNAVRESYTIAGKPLTDKHIEKIETYILKNPDVGRLLTIEEVARRVLPTAVKAGPKPSPAKGPGGSPHRGQPVATIVDEGSGSGGAPPAKWQPKAGDTVESAVTAAGMALFGVRR